MRTIDENKLFFLHFYSSEMVYLGTHIQMGILGTDIGTMGVKKGKKKGKGLMPLISFLASPKNQKTDLVCKFGTFFFHLLPF